MSGDVQEVENSIMSSLDMLFKNPILIVAYFSTLLFISWQLTLFTIVFVPIMGWFMGKVGRKLKAKSIKAQGLWSDTMSQVEETLGGLRIIKAFCAEKKMNVRFDSINTMYRNDIMKVNIRQQMAHPMSEFLGTVMIVIVLWFGGTLVLRETPVITGPSFIYYLVMLYSIIQPLKDFSKAGYNIPKGLASMERVDKILLAENNIKEPEKPVHISSFEHQIEFRHVSFKITEDTYECIITNLDRTEFSSEDIKELYNKRWGIETSFRHVKYAIGLNSHHAKKRKYIKQEIYISLTLYNLIQRFIRKIKIKKRNKKYIYQINFTRACHLVRSFLNKKDGKNPSLENLIANEILPIRPGRSHNRNVKRKSFIYFNYRFD